MESICQDNGICRAQEAEEGSLISEVKRLSPGNTIFRMKQIVLS